MQDQAVIEAGTYWRIKCHREYLSDACRFAGLNPRHAMLQDVLDVQDFHSNDYAVEFPGPYCQTREQFVYLVADLARRGINFELVVRQLDPETHRTLSYTRLFPRLSKATMTLLWELDPRKAAQMSDWEDRINQVFERMRAELSLGPTPEWQDEFLE